MLRVISSWPGALDSEHVFLRTVTVQGVNLLIRAACL